MRADRLLSLMILLQTRGKMCASALARELEVSERTIYRDIQVLSASGFPVFTETGKYGGFSLIEDYKMNLTGLNTDEVRALAMINVPQAFDDLGMGQMLKAAMLKLVTSLSQDQRRNEAWMRQRFYLDAQQKPTTPNHLGIIQNAVWSDCHVLCRFQYPFNFGISESMKIAPYSLVASDGRWYFIGARKDFIRVYAFDRLHQVEMTDEPFTRPPVYDVRQVWQGWQQTQQDNQHHYCVRVRMAAETYQRHPWREHTYATVVEAADDESKPGWLVVDMTFTHYFEARGTLLNLGSDVEVLSPQALRFGMQDYARQVLQVYGQVA